MGGALAPRWSGHVSLELPTSLMEGVALVSFSHCAQASVTKSLNNVHGVPLSPYDKSGYASRFFLDNQGLRKSVL